MAAMAVILTSVRARRDTCTASSPTTAASAAPPCPSCAPASASSDTPTVCSVARRHARYCTDEQAVSMTAVRQHVRDSTDW